MRSPHGSRTLLAVSFVLALLLAVLAVLQYRWSARVASADLQREKEHLDSSAALFVNEFNSLVTQAIGYLQNDAANAVRAGQPLSAPPRLIAGVYYVEGSNVQQRGADGRLVSASLPDWAPKSCGALIVQQPLAIMAPVFDLNIAAESAAKEEVRIVRRAAPHLSRCFLARLDDVYIHRTVVPGLIRSAFGPTASADYDFRVAAVSDRRPANFDLQRTFFAVLPPGLAFGKHPQPEPGHTAIIVQRVESSVVGNLPFQFAPLYGPGAWELGVTHKGEALAAHFEQTRRRNLLLSVAVELLLLAAIAFLLVAARRMHRLANQKMQFVAGVSHELRTPVSALAMLSRNQADGLVSSPQQVKQYGELMHEQSRRLNDMVEQSLRYAGIHSGLRPVAKDKVDLRALIEETLDARRDDLARAGFEVEVALAPDLPPVTGDPHWLRTAADNLVSNALKHAGRGLWIRIGAVYVPKQKEIRVSVEDRGAGIDPADQREIFEPFYRGRAAVDAQIPGSGLGLSLVRSAAEAHRGSVTLNSEPGRGSIFTLHLPV